MSEKIDTQGICQNCNQKVNRTKAKEHIEICFAQNPLEPSQANAFNVKVQWPHKKPIYWIYLAVPFKRTLEDLDDFLRDFWLECCGHLSEFIILEEHYTADHEYADSLLPYSESSMKIKVSKVLSPGLKFTHEYDFGTTTELLLETVGLMKLIKPKEIFLLMQNESPMFKCSSCERPATLCAEETYYCKKCGKEGDYLLPLVNSPRTGMCGYY